MSRIASTATPLAGHHPATLTGTVFIVDDDASVRDSTALYLSLKGFQTQLFACGEDFLSAMPDEPVGCVLLDLRMPGLSGIEVHQQLLRSRPELPVIFLTAHGDVATVRQCLKAGASDFIEKPVDHDMLIEAVNKALAQQANLAADRDRQSQKQSRLSRLTPRESEVLRLLAEGLQNRDVAVKLDISPRTVEVYKARLMEKLQTRTLADLIRVVFDEKQQ
ncbi:response regulator transcription factor [Hydrocarboniphaga effusa]|jgi:FixJ family two-component response regulator|uniref:response regulator transcription factor n=1 Tax=Hydrocarboniphaga effusa TaxID=243629 RepID=UPI0031381613